MSGLVAVIRKTWIGNAIASSFLIATITGTVATAEVAQAVVQAPIKAVGVVVVAAVN